MIKLFKSGLPSLTFHIVSHSLGVQVAGYTGRFVQSLSDYKFTLPRITGLDPAGPFWYPGPNGPVGTRVPISKLDAVFVDIIHTDAGVYGAPVSTGSIDFWPNGGIYPQPGCPNDPAGINIQMITTYLSYISLTYCYYRHIDFCSHHRSWYFWAESLIPKHPIASFLSLNAASWKDFQNGNITFFFPIHMGIQAPFGYI